MSSPVSTIYYVGTLLNNWKTKKCGLLLLPLLNIEGELQELKHFGACLACVILFHSEKSNIHLCGQTNTPHIPNFFRTLYTRIKILHSCFHWPSICEQTRSCSSLTQLPTNRRRLVEKTETIQKTSCSFLPRTHTVSFLSLSRVEKNKFHVEALLFPIFRYHHRHHLHRSGYHYCSHPP